MMETFGHNLENQGPGSHWRGQENAPLVGEHRTTVADLLSDHHFDVFVRYGYADAVVNGSMDEEYDFWRNFYNKMQTERVGSSRPDDFEKLIYSFEKNGFQDGEVIPVDQNYEILDGSHRLACSALFDVNPTVAIYGQSSHDYSHEWFVEKGFSNEEIMRAEDVRRKLFSRYSTYPENSYVGVIWGMAIEYWDFAIGSIGESHIRRAFIRDFGGQIEEFVRECYRTDGMIQDKIDTKARKLSQRSKLAGILVLDEDTESHNQAKKRIREEISAKMESYFFDCVIHLIDHQDEGEFIVKKYDVKGRNHAS